jgi:hypothetical protein
MISRVSPSHPLEFRQYALPRLPFLFHIHVPLTTTTPTPTKLTRIYVFQTRRLTIGRTTSPRQRKPRPLSQQTHLTGAMRAIPAFESVLDGDVADVLADHATSVSLRK